MTLTLVRAFCRAIFHLVDFIKWLAIILLFLVAYMTTVSVIKVLLTLGYGTDVAAFYVALTHLCMLVIWVAHVLLLFYPHDEELEEPLNKETNNE